MRQSSDLKHAHAIVKLAALVHTSNVVAAASGRLDKTSKLAAFLKDLMADEVPIAIVPPFGVPSVI